MRILSSREENGRGDCDHEQVTEIECRPVIANTALGLTRVFTVYSAVHAPLLLAFPHTDATNLPEISDAPEEEMPLSSALPPWRLFGVHYHFPTRHLVGCAPVNHYQLTIIKSHGCFSHVLNNFARRPQSSP